LFRSAVNVIVSSAVGNGSIAPSGIVLVSSGADQRFVMSPSAGYHVDSVLVDAQRVDSTASYTFRAVVTSHSITAHFGQGTQLQQTTFAVTAGWNLVSVPRVPVDSTAVSLFPGAEPGTVYRYQNGSYAQLTTLRPGEGYWAYYVTASTDSISGVSVNSASVSAPAGNSWVLVGSVTASVPVTALTSNPPGAIVPGTVFGWNGSAYATPTTIEPGSAYWVLVDQPCTLTIQQ
jgi:hypothetical protein